MAVNVQFLRFTKDKEVRKLGFSQVGERTDSLTKANLAALEKALDSGKLTDLEGQPVTDHAYIRVWALVSKVKPKVDAGLDDEFEGAGGTIAIHVDPSADTNGATPFDL